MAYKTYTVDDLSSFAGRPKASFHEPYTTDSALPQALLLFKLGTCLASPDGLSATDLQLVDFAILSMADAVGLASKYASVAASPFSSETIGSYSYSKAARAVMRGEDTGVMWFDTAIKRLSVCDTADDTAMSGGIEVFERVGGYFTPGHLAANVQFLTPADLVDSRLFGYDPQVGE